MPRKIFAFTIERMSSLFQWPLCLALVVSACDLGTVNGAATGADAAGGGGGGGGGNCESLVANQPNGRHNPGTACQNSGCHGGAAPASTVFTVSGTLYTTQAGTAVAAGGTITIGSKKLIVAANGNFYSTEAITTPTSAAASLCPDTQTRANHVNKPEDGNCNSCHNGSVTKKIYLK